MCLVKGFHTVINICCVKFLNSVAWPLRIASISTHINDLSRQETIRFLLTHKCSLKKTNRILCNIYHYILFHLDNFKQHK